jgi:hypothetical protein
MRNFFLDVPCDKCPIAPFLEYLAGLIFLSTNLFYNYGNSVAASCHKVITWLHGIYVTQYVKTIINTVK